MSPQVQPACVPQHPHHLHTPGRGSALPPIVPPVEAKNTMSDPPSASSSSFPPLTRSNSSQSDAPSSMHHILNPAATGASASKPPTPDMGPRQQPLPPISIQRSVSGERPSAHFPYSNLPLAGQHRLSASNLASPTGTIDAKKSPFLPTTGSGPAMGPSPFAPSSQLYGPKPGYPLHPQGPSPVSVARRGSDGVSAHGSRTGSPTPSYSSYGQPSTAQGSPHLHFSAVTHHGPQAMYHTQVQQGLPQVAQPVPSPQQLHHPHGQFPPPQHHAVVQHSGAYRMMTIETDQGPVQVPVDVQAASKMADEKRRRNAGASARFRQRRKEKERESATTISNLEGKIRDAVEEKEFYRAERDYFRELVYKNEGARASLVPRMPSPGLLSECNRQGSLTSSREAGTEGARSPSSGTAEYKETGDRGSDDGRVLRRRVSAYEPEQRGSSQQQPQQSAAHYGASRVAQSTDGMYGYPKADSHMELQEQPPAYTQSKAVVPPTMRTGPYEAHGSGHHIHYEQRWAAHS